MEITGRSPLKDLGINRPSVFFHPQQFDKLGRCTVLGQDVMQLRIEQLEREKVELSTQLHLREEKDRTAKQNLEHLQQQRLKDQQIYDEVLQALEVSKSTINSLQNDRERLENEIRKLTREQQESNSDSAQNQSLWQRMTAASRELRRVEEEAKQFKDNNIILLESTNSLTTQRDAFQKQIVLLESELTILKNEREEAISAIAKLEILSKEHQTISMQLSASEVLRVETVQQFIQEIEKMNEEKKQLQDENKNLKTELGTLKIKSKECDASETDITSLNMKDAQFNDSEMKGMFTDLMKKYVDSEKRRRQLHAQLQDLRGNVRVFVRCRPFLAYDGEDARKSGCCIKFNIDGSSLSLVGTARGAGQIFCFDNVFKQESTQESVYEPVADLVQSAIDGYRVCIFSYGQTGSGKTHTMTGSEGEMHEGIIPRAVRQVISSIMCMREAGWATVVCTASIVELYNEELRDLLVRNSQSATSSSFLSSSDAKEKLKISFNQGRVSISGLTGEEIDLSSVQSGMSQLNKLLARATQSRTTACTGMNERSSRSHVLFMLDINGRHSDGVTVMQGGLRLVDLAGSERLDRTGTLNDATRLKETVNINKSLSSLSDVFLALGNKSSHVPYRNSKLTLLLQDCLSGEGKALMLVNISPTLQSSQETLCSLRFAGQVSQVELGRAQKQIFTAPTGPTASAASTNSSSASGLPTQTTSSKVSSKSSSIVTVSNAACNSVINASTIVATQHQPTTQHHHIQPPGECASVSTPAQNFPLKFSGSSRRSSMCSSVHTTASLTQAGPISTDNKPLSQQSSVLKRNFPSFSNGNTHTLVSSSSCAINIGVNQSEDGSSAQQSVGSLVGGAFSSGMLTNSNSVALAAAKRLKSTAVSSSNPPNKSSTWR